MKKLFLIFIPCFAYGQGELNKVKIGDLDKPFILQPIDKGDKILFLEKNQTELRLNSKGDTLEIYPASKIKYIKIDGIVYKIKRTVELVEGWRTNASGWLSTEDIRIHQNKQK